MSCTTLFYSQLFTVFALLYYVVPKLLLPFTSWAVLPNAIGGFFLTLVISWKTTKWIRRSFLHRILPVDGKSIFITGCDRGFGHLLAKRLNSLGLNVYAGCLEPNGIGAMNLLKSAKYPKTMYIIPLDVRSDESVQSALTLVTTSTGERLWGIVNNAGIAAGGQLEWGKMSDYYSILEVNTFGTLRVTRAFLPLIRASQGRVINVSSIAGRISGAGMAHYSMSKHAITAFSVALRREMYPWGVKVSTIEPFIYRTEMTDIANMIKLGQKVWEETPEAIRQDYGDEFLQNLLDALEEDVGTRRGNPEEVIDAMVDGLMAVEPEIVYRVCSPIVNLFWTIHDLLPYCLVDYLVNKIYYSRAGFPRGVVQ